VELAAGLIAEPDQGIRRAPENKNVACESMISRPAPTP
jgi:hypothetical protein